MSRRKIQFRRNVAQYRRVKGNEAPIIAIIPTIEAKSDGKKTIYGKASNKDDDGEDQKNGRRYPGRGSGRVCSVPASPATVQRMVAWAK